MQRAAAALLAQQRAEEEARRLAALAELMARLREQAAVFTSDRLKNMSKADLKNLDAEMLGVFTQEQMQSLSAEMIGSLSVEQIKKLTKEQVSARAFCLIHMRVCLSKRYEKC